MKKFYFSSLQGIPLVSSAISASNTTFDLLFSTGRIVAIGFISLQIAFFLVELVLVLRRTLGLEKSAETIYVLENFKQNIFC